MQVFKTVSAVHEYVQQAKNNKKKVGFVPTMGALHHGHLSLVKASLECTDISIVSIFVNPTQFNDKNDLTNYPRNFEADKKLLEEIGCHAIFNPEVEEMYPEPDNRIFNFEGLDAVMEGAHRPGHFNGVAQVVSKLFDAVPADKAFFGLKDFQQLAIIKKLKSIVNFSTEIVPCEIVREPDGLAMSSRNLLLAPDHRKSAGIIYKTLSIAKSMTKDSSINQIIDFVTKKINQNPLFNVEYFELVNTDTLISVKEAGKGTTAIACIAVWAGKIRLIDNMIFNF